MNLALGKEAQERNKRMGELESELMSKIKKNEARTEELEQSIIKEQNASQLRGREFDSFT